MGWEDEDEEGGEGGKEEGNIGPQQPKVWVCLKGEYLVINKIK